MCVEEEERGREGSDCVCVFMALHVLEGRVRGGSVHVCVCVLCVCVCIEGRKDSFNNYSKEFYRSVTVYTYGREG